MAKGAYTPEFTPVAYPDNVLALDDGKEVDHYRIERFTPLPVTPLETFTVPDGDDDQRTLSNLEVWDGWLGQYRFPRLTEELPDDVTIEVDHGGKKDPAYQTVNKRGRISNETPYQFVQDPDDTDQDIESLLHLLEMYVFEDEVPSFTVINQSGDEVDVDLTAAGFAFQLEPVSERDFEQTPVAVPIEAIRGD